VELAGWNKIDGWAGAIIQLGARGEYTRCDSHEVLYKWGIQLSTSPAHISEFNGVAEWFN
jgi:hypothetical protein